MVLSQLHALNSTFRFYQLVNHGTKWIYLDPSPVSKENQTLEATDSVLKEILEARDL